ncbi:MAG: hypothetical protein IPP07_13630 [Holophagales bacterium]|nr:hypothetical protein [Holophagales bacterium]
MMKPGPAVLTTVTLREIAVAPYGIPGQGPLALVISKSRAVDAARAGGP